MTRPGAVYLLHAVVGLTLLAAAPVAARPNPWQQVRDSGAAARAELLRRADRARTLPDADPESLALSSKLNERSAVMLELARALQLGDADLLFLQGDCWARASGPHAAAAERALTAALSLRPEHPLAASGLGQLAAALGAQGKRAEQRAALRRALLIEPDPETRAQLAVELGRSLLKDEQPKAATEVLSVAGSDAPGSEAWALAEWTLAVAYDLGYDFPEAMKHVIPASQARFGESGQTGLLDIPAVNALLGHEKFYYFALSLTARAAKLNNKEEQTKQLQAALLMWLGYRSAAPQADRWRTRVEEHLTEIRRALASPLDGNLDREALTPPDFSL